MPPRWAFATIRELAAALRRGETTSRTLTEFFLERLERLGPTFNAVVTVTRELALSQAQRADEELAAGVDRGPLHGIPYGAKDLLATKGIRTTWGAAPLREQVIDADATAIQRLRAAGAVLVAKLAMVELAGGFGYRQANASFTGPGLNAWDRSRWAGGSSSGSGSAVAAGLVPFAIGSETSGSILTPAGYNGVTGLRPTFGRVSRAGAMALSWTLDKLGPMCRSAEDCGLVLAALAGPDPADPTAVVDPFRFPWEGDISPRGPKWRIGIVRGATQNVDPAVRDNFQQSVQVLAEFAECVEVALPEFPYGAVVGTIISCEQAAAFEGFIREGKVWELTAPEDRWGGHSTLAIPAKDYINAQRIRAHIQAAWDALLTEYDALIAPTLSTVAGPVDKDFREWSKGFASTSLGVGGNAAGVPAISLPNGFSPQQLPTGLHVVARAFDEHRLLELAMRYQRRTDWHRRHPNLD
uniref:Amidase n=1 Tax=Schlesneria paludicola TaxID=360056 RepID=A0A7C4QMM7_9PLAN